MKMMPIPIKTDEEVSAMRESCYYAALVLDEMVQAVVPGITTYDLDQLGRERIAAYGGKSACYNYQIGSRRFPAYTCISVNNEVVHGIGSAKKTLLDGDIVSIDVSIIYNGFIGDNAKTVQVGCVTPELQSLLDCAARSLDRGINQAKVGNHVGDISFAVQQEVEAKGYSVVRDFVGHGVGRTMHEEPQIPNFGQQGTGPILMSGMTLAIEPMVNQGSHQVYFADDGWTALTRDNSPSAHFEHTVLITDNGPEILTITKK